MENKKIIILGSIAGFLLLVLIGMLFMRSNETEIALDLNTEVPVEVDQPLVEVMTVAHQYDDGIHTVVGNLTLPTPCYTYNAIANILDDNSVIIEITTESTDEMCAQVMTDVTFRVSFEGDEETDFTGLLNGNPIIFNTVIVPEGGSIDDFESIIKG